MRLVLAVLAVSNLFPLGFGGPIGTYIFTGKATGTFAGVVFHTDALTITGMADTAVITSNHVLLFLYFGPGVATISVGGLGSGTFTGASYVYDNQNTGIVGFGTSHDFIQVRDADFGSTAFLTYALTTSIGPLGFVTNPVAT